MREFPDYVTPERRERDRRYRKHIGAALMAAVLFHALLVVTVQPFREHIPLVRRMGYRGPIRIMPEISIMREIVEDESDLESRAGALGGRGFRVVEIEVRDWSLPSGGETDLSEQQAELDAGDDLLNELESSLPQPMSTEVVISRFVKPRYPPSSLETGVEGVVTFKLEVTETGEVRRAWLIDSEVDDACNIEAYSAVMQWRFSPYRIDGVATPMLVEQRIRFRIRDALGDASGS